MSPPLAHSLDIVAQNTGGRGDSHFKNVTLTQSGRMKTKLGQESWIPFTAHQTISVSACLFDWRARLGPFGMIVAHDALTIRGGQFDVLAFGLIPIVKAEHSAGLTRGELMRYLAELVWVPDALLCNASLRWREGGPSTLMVNAGEGLNAAEIALTLDSDNRIASLYAPDRPRSVGASFIPTAWRGTFSDYRQHQTRWLPFAGDVAWHIDGTWETYFQCRLESWSIL